MAVSTLVLPACLARRQQRTPVRALQPITRSWPRSVRATRTVPAPARLRLSVAADEGEHQTEPQLLPTLSDALVSFAVVSPLVATFWRGSWVLADQILPADPTAAAWTSTTVGTGLIVLLHALRLPQPSDPVRLTLSESVRERAFSYFLALAGVFTWHGVWELWEVYTEEMTPWQSGLLCHLLGLGGLLALRSLRSSLAPPACVVLDDDAAYGSLIPTLQRALQARGITRLWD